MRAARNYVRRREGGIIWHTQGSGKSLTMVWLGEGGSANSWELTAACSSSTDRTELDEQIEMVFQGVDEDIYRTKNGGDSRKYFATPPSR